MPRGGYFYAYDDDDTPADSVGGGVAVASETADGPAAAT